MCHGAQYSQVDHEKGIRVTPTEQSAKFASTQKTGLFATLRALLRAQGSGAPSRTLIATPSVILAALFGPLAFSAAPASGANGHAFGSSFGSPTSIVKDTESEPLSDPTGVAWSKKTEEIYVIDTGHDRVVRFSAAGSPLGAFEAPAGGFASPNAIAVDNDPSSESYGDIYVSDQRNDAIDKFDHEGKYTGYQLTEATTGASLGEIEGVAVDPTGSLWVYDNNGGVDEFDDTPDNKLVQHEEMEQGTEGPGIAIDSQENMYIVNSYDQRAMKWSPGRHFAGQTENCGCFVTGVAVDAGTNNVYVDQGATVAKYAPFAEPFTEPEEVFGSDSLTEGTGITVSSATHTVYVTDSKANDVVVFEEGPKPTLPLTEKAEPIEGVSATLKGKLEGGESGYYFSYNKGSTCKDGKTTPTIPATGSEQVSAKITGLIAKTKYTFCLLDENKYGHESGAPETFITTPSVPQVEMTSSSVRLARATLSASVNAELETSTCVFQYGKSESYEHETPCEPATLGAGEAGAAATASVKGLEPNTTYDYRVLASNGTGHQAGPNETFTTEVITPTQVETAPASDITGTSAVIGGQVNPQGGASYYVEYGSPTCSINGIPNFAWWLCASKSGEAGPLSGDSLQTVAPIEITGLAPGTTYSYWIVAYNLNGSERGEELTFTTPGATPVTPPVAIVPTITPLTIVPSPAPAKPPIKKKTPAQEKAGKLGNALKQCKQDRAKARRRTCEAQARKRYGPKTKSKPQSHTRGK